MWPSLPRPSSTKSSATPTRAWSYSSAATPGGSSPRIRWIAPGRTRRRREQVLVREAVVRALVVGRHAPLVAPPERDARSSPARARRPARRRGAGVEPPVSTIVPPRVAYCASCEATSAAGSRTTRSSGGVAMFMVARVRDRRRPRPADRRSRGRPTRRTARAGRRPPRPRPSGPRGVEASFTRPRSRARPRSYRPSPSSDDDADRPRAEAALALEPPGDDVGRQVLQALRGRARGRGG